MDLADRHRIACGRTGRGIPQHLDPFYGSRRLPACARAPPLPLEKSRPIYVFPPCFVHRLSICLLQNIRPRSLYCVGIAFMTFIVWKGYKYHLQVRIRSGSIARRNGMFFGRWLVTSALSVHPNRLPAHRRYSIDLVVLEVPTTRRRHPVHASPPEYF